MVVIGHLYAQIGLGSCFFIKWANFRPNRDPIASLWARIPNKTIVKKREFQCWGYGVVTRSGGKNAVYALRAPAGLSGQRKLSA
jgi:hypothetical protein